MFSVFGLLPSMAAYGSSRFQIPPSFVCSPVICTHSQTGISLWKLCISSDRHISRIHDSPLPTAHHSSTKIGCVSKNLPVCALFVCHTLPLILREKNHQYGGVFIQIGQFALNLEECSLILRPVHLSFEIRTWVCFIYLLLQFLASLWTSSVEVIILSHCFAVKG